MFHLLDVYPERKNKLPIHTIQRCVKAKMRNPPFLRLDLHGPMLMDFFISTQLSCRLNLQALGGYSYQHPFPNLEGKHECVIPAGQNEQVPNRRMGRSHYIGRETTKPSSYLKIHFPIKRGGNDIAGCVETQPIIQMQTLID